MAADDRLKALRGHGRRDFLRWTTAVAAALGLERSRYLNVLSDNAGVALADTASCASTMRSVHFVGGTGGFAWFTLVFPVPGMATVTTPVTFHALGKVTQAQGANRPLVFAPETPWQSQGPKKQVSAFVMPGRNQAHTQTPARTAMISQNTSMLAALSAIQSANATLLPVIGINPFDFGSAPGQAPVATVNNADGLVGLFDSAASKSLLKAPEDAALHETYLKVFLSLNAAAGRPSTKSGYDGAKVSANLLGQKLAEKLRPQAADLAKYGITAETNDDAILNIAKALSIGVRAFELGLTSMLIIPAFGDDPHGAFNNGTDRAAARAVALGKVLDGFMTEASARQDPSCQRSSLADTIVLTAHGDTPKNPFSDRGNWDDGTPRGANWLYVLGNGYLNTGWFGEVTAQGCQGFDPTNGATSAAASGDSSAYAAAAAVAYAVSKGDNRRVQDFYTGPELKGLTKPVIT